MESLTSFLTEASVMEIIITVATKLGIVLLVYIFGRWFARGSQRALERMLRKREVDEVLVDFLGTVTNVLITVLVVVAALDILGIPATSLVAVVGAAGLAIGLALKDSLSNFASGVMLVLYRPFTKGDYVDAGGVSGTVQEVSLNSTLMLTPDNKEIIVPNGMVWGGPITNYSARDTRRVDLTFGVGYNDDLKKAAEVLAKVCKENPKVLEEPATSIFVSNLGDSSVDFACRPWVNSGDYWGVYAEILETAKVELEAAGLSIPYPQSDVHMHEVKKTKEQSHG
jgi:small conductance mechanosensitive channel